MQSVQWFLRFPRLSELLQFPCSSEAGVVSLSRWLLLLLLWLARAGGGVDSAQLHAQAIGQGDGCEEGRAGTLLLCLRIAVYKGAHISNMLVYWHMED